MSNKTNEVLASDGEVKAAGAPTRKDGEASQPSPYTPAAAPVCAWRRGGERGWLQPSCTDAWTFSPYFALPDGCPSCGLPISFKSEAAR